MRIGDRVPSGLRAAVVAVAAAMATGCGSNGSDGGDRLTLTGSSTIAPVAAEVGKRFEQNRAGIRVEVQTGGSGRGITDALRGLNDIGMASRRLQPNERGVLTSHIIARDAIAVIVNAQNPVTALSHAQIADIYTGTIERWAGLGGPDEAITVVNKASGRGTLAVFLDHFDLDNRAVTADAVVGHNEQAIATVAGDPYAIGYVSLGPARAAVAENRPIKLLPAEGVSPTPTALRNDRYPIARPLLLLTKGSPDALEAAFIELARSTASHEIVRELGFVPVTPTETPPGGA